jgi:ribosomal protein S18 acetylase RimI-like enzyme
MASIQIRPASARDAPGILPLMAAYWQHDAIPGFDAERLTRQLHTFLSTPEFGRAWLAVLGEQTVGYLLITFVYSFEHGGLMAEIDELYVDRSHRGQHVGTQLISSAISYLCEQSVVALQMQVEDGNVPAQRFYRKLGFTPKAGHRLWVSALSP